jgi:hypothetical protein
VVRRHDRPGRRDFELGAFAWVGQVEPAGRTLYACDQVPLPSNNWEGQNYMGWCNENASRSIVRATNTLIRDDRVAAYDRSRRNSPPTWCRSRSSSALRPRPGAPS